MNNYTFRNWSRVFSSRPENYLQPETEEELVGLVQQALAEEKRIRLVGAGHSWSHIALTDSLMLNLDGYSRVLDIDKDKQQVTVQAGIRLKKLNAALNINGMAMANLGSISEQSIAGAISTATHGTGIGHAVLATQVVAMRLVTGTGEVLELDAKDGDLWKAAQVSLGCLGIISTVTLQCVPAFNLEEAAWPMRFDEAIAQLPDLIRQNHHLKLWWFPHVNFLQVYAYNRTDKPVYDPRQLARRFEDNFLTQQFFTFLLRTGIAMPAMVPPINRLIKVIKFKADQRVDKSYNVLNVPIPPRHREAEYAIPVEDAGQALLDIRQMIEEQKLRINFVVEVRFTKGDDILLSPCFGRDSCYLGAYKAGNAGWMEYIKGFEQIITKYKGRPHWGKEFTYRKEEIQAMYPHMQAFRNIRDQLDPRGIFVNRFIEETIL